MMVIIKNVQSYILMKFNFCAIRNQLFTCNRGQNCRDIVLKYRVTSIILTPPPHLHSKLGCLLFSTGSSNSGTTLHGGDGGGKALLTPFNSVQHQQAPFGQSVSTNFVTDCRLSAFQYRPLD